MSEEDRAPKRSRLIEEPTLSSSAANENDADAAGGTQSENDPPPSGPPSARENRDTTPEEDGREIGFDDLPDEVRKNIFGRLDVKTLCLKREVSPEWKRECEQAIEDKKEDGAGVFTTNKDLCKATKKHYQCKYEKYTIALAEEVAVKFGWFIGKWNVSAVTDFSYVFEWQEKFNDYIGDWNVGNGTKFYCMFSSAISFNQDLSNWNMANARRIGCMFFGAKSFNGNISRWNTANVEDATQLFSSAPAFNQDISGWILSKCKKMSAMFHNAIAFNQDLSEWDTSTVDDMFGMFARAASFNQDLSKWDVSNARNRMTCMFLATKMSRVKISSWERWTKVLTQEEIDEMFLDPRTLPPTERQDFILGRRN